MISDSDFVDQGEESAGNTVFFFLRITLTRFRSSSFKGYGATANDTGFKSEELGKCCGILPQERYQKQVIGF
ncbi:hypothetical protein K435DRAFT_878305 [Dendrothele bispora CBS 962.96]|uniref:Uncharacterized protein n=1 Tax=Dendrothele bispora (strain CBS 962.96) TaxID=1314807 RepID=A0A4S8KN60_DENBC|nr:hypothetical protein K435DRAFT_878305 [Dendrothele bispora CBS 962.96]